MSDTVFCCNNRRFMYASSSEILEEMIAECKCGGEK